MFKLFEQVKQKITPREIYESTKERTENQRKLILDKFVKNGDRGVTTRELMNICADYTARLSELYKEGFDTRLESEGNGCRFWATAYPPKIKKEWEKAIDELQQIIKKKHNNSVSWETLQQILFDLNSNVVRKSGYYKGWQL